MHNQEDVFVYVCECVAEREKEMGGWSTVWLSRPTWKSSSLSHPSSPMEDVETLLILTVDEAMESLFSGILFVVVIFIFFFV